MATLFKIRFGQWPGRPHRRYLVAGILTLVTATVCDWPRLAYAVDSSQLWLPRNYYRHFKRLYKAAEVAEQTEMCRYVIAGTLAQNRSDKKHPVFKITCRDNERMTFAYIVDGLSYEILNRPPPPDPEEVKLQALNRRLDELWLICFDQLEQRTRGLRGVSWLSTEVGEQRPPAVMNGDDDILYQVRFNASGGSGNLLRYQASCHFKNGDKSIGIYAYLDEREDPREGEVPGGREMEVAEDKGGGEAD